MRTLFFSRENQNNPWKRIIALFLGFFQGYKKNFTSSFSINFTGSPKFSRLLFELFPRVKLDFHW